MFSALSDVRHWFRSSQEATLRRRAGDRAAGMLDPRGALVLADGTILELDYTDRADERKLSGIDAGQVVGVGWRDRRGAGWSVEVRGALLTRHRGGGATLAEAVAAALEAHYTAEAAEIALREDPVAHLGRELARHDWWHMMSDAFGTSIAGERHMGEILGIAARCPADEVRALWAKHAPADFKCPV
jgi:hypothetical protein